MQLESYTLSSPGHHAAARVGVFEIEKTRPAMKIHEAGPRYRVSALLLLETFPFLPLLFEVIVGHLIFLFPIPYCRTAGIEYLFRHLRVLSVRV